MMRMDICLLSSDFREHNRVCDVLKKEHPEWNDDRLFETARLIITGMEILKYSKAQKQAFKYGWQSARSRIQIPQEGGT